MVRASVILALSFQAAFGLHVKTDNTFGLDPGLEGIPQRLAKVFALGSAGKATNDMVATEIQEIMEKSRGLSSDKITQLAQVVKDMFPEDAVDLEEVTHFKNGPAIQSLMETSADKVDSEGNPSKRNAYMYYTKKDQHLDKNPTKEMKLEDQAKLTCIPDNLAACLIKDTDFLPCRTFNQCVGLYNNAASGKDNEYAQSLKHDPKGFAGHLNMRGKAALAAGLSTCYAANLLTMPMIATTKPALHQLGITGKQADAISSYHEKVKGKTAILDKEEEKQALREKQVPIKDRILCSAAFNGNVKLAKAQTHLAELLVADQRKFEHGGGPNNHHLQLKAHAKNTLNEIISEMGKEASLWATDPMMMWKHTLLGEKTNSYNEHGHAGFKTLDGLKEEAHSQAMMNAANQLVKKFD